MAVFDFLRDKRDTAATPAESQGQKQAEGQPLAESQPPAEDSRQLVYLPIGAIRPNPYQPRKTFDDGALSELADSISQVGLIQPLVVRHRADGYELVAGERRLRACKLLAYEEVACIVEEEMVDRESAMVALIENLQRENLHYLEEAECYQQLLDAYQLTQDELAEQLGRSQSSIANKLRVLRLPAVVKEAMVQARMTERQARTLIRLKDEETQLKIIDRVKEKALSVKDTEKLVEKTLNQQYDSKQDGATPRPKILRYLRDYRLFVNSVNVAAGQLRDAGMLVEVEQTDLADGMDLMIRVRREEP